jgi:rhomboid family GlyGly-CTERM serine protease
MFPEILATLRYDRTAVLEGNYFRLITGQLVHINFPHMLANTSVWIVSAVMAHDLGTSRHWCQAMLVCLTGCSIAIHFFLDIPWYAGASGGLHGVLCVVAMLSILRGNLWGVVVLSLIFVKVMLEFNGIFWHNYDFKVVTEAHLFGTLIGLMYAIFIFRYRYG